ncbi:MAG: hypothetical protein K2J16_05100 [Clostridia bacterium]|nr:hypothetical protein [Clostridia bacterium]
MANSKMKLISKILCLSLILVMASGILCACNTNKRHAVLYDNVGEYINSQFMAENLTFKGNGNIAENKCFIIRTQKEFDKIFTGFYKDIDFNKQMVLLKAIGFCTTAHKFKLFNIIIEDKKLTAEYYYVDCKDGEDCASAPYIRYVALVINKMDISEFDFVH